MFISFDKFRSNEGKEAVSLSRLKIPSEVRKAVGTEGEVPLISGKPGKVSRGVSMDKTPLGILKAANIKQNTGRIEKGVIVLAINLYTIAFSRHFEMA